MKSHRRLLALFALTCALAFSSATTAFAQTTTFTYQGRLTDSAVLQPTNGTYEMQFKAFDAVANGNQFASTITNTNVQVVNGVFTVQLDFGALTFRGQDVFLEIGVRPVGNANPYTLLTPRQQVTSAPYAIQSLNSINALSAGDSLNLGGTAANLYVQTSDARLSDGRAPTAGSGNYVQNTNSVQPFSNFNVSGNGTVGSILTGNVVNSATQYNIGGNRMLSIPGTNNTFAGISTGAANTTGTGNSFFGTQAGQANTVGTDNSFFGKQAGKASTGAFNSFFGAAAGLSNTTGQGNSFFGRGAGSASTTASNNSFFGGGAGQSNTAEGNSFFGFDAGLTNTSGSNNSFFGDSAGLENNGGKNSFFGSNSGSFNTTGDDNSFFGAFAGSFNSTGHSNSFFGNHAGFLSNGNNNTAIGDSAGKSLSAGGNNAFVGWNSGSSLTVGFQNAFFGSSSGSNVTSGLANTAIGDLAGTSVTTGNSNTFLGVGADGAATISNSTAIGAGAQVTTSNTIVLGTSAENTIVKGGLTVFGSTSVIGTTTLATLGAAGANHLCINAANQIANCSSSLRYKTNLAPYLSGMGIINRLRPITFDWKQGGMHDVGFGAEEVEQIDPLLVTYNNKGQVEGVKYDRISVALVNAVKEQQAQIKQQQQQIASLKKLVCRNHSRAAVCK